jgi:hypothetical protein
MGDFRRASAGHARLHKSRGLRQLQGLSWVRFAAGGFGEVG